MKRIAAATVAAFALLIGGIVAAPAASAHRPGHIRCEDIQITTCLLNYKDGYWLAQRFYGDGPTGFTWVRLTMKSGLDSSHVGAITCPRGDSCVIDYYDPGNYWMARQASGTTWVRLTQL
ncbi:MAG: hypothetical protein ACRCSN_19830 [Dermatophilaceae bacterium]